MIQTSQISDMNISIFSSRVLWYFVQLEQL